jgi:hypothetical protein
VSRVRVRADDVWLAERIVDTSGVVPYLEVRIAATTGRKRVLPVRTLLVGLVLAGVCEQPQHIRRIHELLSELDAVTRRRLGLDYLDRRTGQWMTCSEEALSKLWNRLLRRLDPSKRNHKARRKADKRRRALGERVRDAEPKLTGWDLHARELTLQWISDRLLDASIPDEVRGIWRGSLALDATGFQVWSTGRQDPRDTTDVDAGWISRGGRVLVVKRSAEKGRKQFDAKIRTAKRHVYGYEMQATSMVDEDSPSPVPIPNLVYRMVLTRGGANPATAARGIFERIADEGGPIGDIVCDRAYTFKLPATFHWPLMARGWQIVGDLHPDQMGTKGVTANGSLALDGCLYCPALALKKTAYKPPFFKNLSAIAAAEKKVAQRKPYELWANGEVDEDGYQRLGCPASGKSPTVRCANKPESLRLPRTLPLVANPPGQPLPDGTRQPLPTVCQQVTVTEPVAAILGNTIGKHRHQTPEWRKSYERRNVVEGNFGVLKAMSTQAMTHGRTQVRGRAKNTLLLTCMVIGANLRLIRSWRDRLSKLDPAAVRTAAKRSGVAVPPAVERLMADTAAVRTRAKRRTSSFNTLVGVRQLRRAAKARGPG